MKRVTATPGHQLKSVASFATVAFIALNENHAVPRIWRLRPTCYCVSIYRSDCVCEGRRSGDKDGLLWNNKSERHSPDLRQHHAQSAGFTQVSSVYRNRDEILEHCLKSKFYAKNFLHWLSYLGLSLATSAQFSLKMSAEAWNRVTFTKTHSLEVHGRSRSPMLLPWESSSTVLITMSVPICNYLEFSGYASQ